MRTCVRAFRSKGFEFFGFDVMLTDKLEPTLVEVIEYEYPIRQRLTIRPIPELTPSLLSPQTVLWCDR